MDRFLSNIVFTKNRPLQLEAYLESLYRYFPRERIQTYILYKAELFDEQYESLFRQFPACVVIRESDFHSDFLNILSQVATKYILFGIDDVVYFDSVDFGVIEATFAACRDDIFGFTLRFDAQMIERGGDPVSETTMAGRPVCSIDWTRGRTPATRYPFELCATILPAGLVRTVIANTMNGNRLARRLFAPNSAPIRAMGTVISTRSLLRSFGYFYNPNTLESWNCRWCQKNGDRLPKRLYFQRLCASAIQVNMVNVTARKTLDGSAEFAVDTLNEKYKTGYRLDVDFVSQNRPSGTHGGFQHFRLKRR
ncbi:MAG: hypothetical protein ACYTEK_16760 [Planctomycetota bacterium]|jgi:hypothetical protein